MVIKGKEVEKYKKKLLELRKQLTQSLQTVKEDVKAEDRVKGYSQHQADEGTDDFVRNINLELTKQEASVLQQIDRALKKIEEGTYGVCDVSGENIPKKRLDAVPYAIMTVDAQDKLEKGLI